MSKYVAHQVDRPFWLSPRQVVVLPVAAPFKAYAQEVANKLWDAGLYADVDNTDSTLNKRIRNSELAQVSTMLCLLGICRLFVQYNFIIVVGQEEQEQRSVNLRNRDDAETAKGKSETVDLELVVKQMVALKAERRLANRLS